MVPQSVVEPTEQRSGISTIAHHWCLRCLPPAPNPARAYCGFTTAVRGNFPWTERCVVCVELALLPCESCGR